MQDGVPGSILFHGVVAAWEVNNLDHFGFLDDMNWVIKNKF